MSQLFKPDWPERRHARQVQHLDGDGVAYDLQIIFSNPAAGVVNDIQIFNADSPTAFVNDKATAISAVGFNFISFGWVRSPWQGATFRANLPYGYGELAARSRCQ